MKEEETIERIRRSVLDYDTDGVTALAHEALKGGISPLNAVEAGVIPAIKLVGEKFGKGDLFLPELVQAAKAAKAAIDIFQGALKKGERNPVGRLVIGTVEGDIHDIGKNLVSVMLSVNGWEIHDIGVDCSAKKFVDKALEVKADIIGASALLTVTIPRQGELIQYLKEQGLRERFKVMVGGAAVEPSWAESIEADGFAEDAQQAVKVAAMLVGR